jgi:Uma2 family endonuclease
MTNAAQNKTRGLEPWLHAPVVGTPYYDEDLDVGQSSAHRIMVSETAPIFADIAREAGLLFLSDEPIWYLHPETDGQKVFYGDCVFAAGSDTARLTADSLRLVIEIVSTHDRRKELKDTRFQRLLNEYNQVIEFGLVFPELDDARALTWLRLVDSEYQEFAVAPGASVISQTVPGLELRVRPKAQWTKGDKLEIYYKGEHRPRLVGERERANLERDRANQERDRANQERDRAERLAARLRELGLDPDA